jgi:predicted HTH domain antitoxin
MNGRIVIPPTFDFTRVRAGDVKKILSTYLSIPDELLVALTVTPEQCGAELRRAAAVKLYEMGRLSSGAAAKLAGIPRVVFLSKLADYGVDTFRLSPHDLAQETPLV